ncbi:MAG TPA: hypothetical protein ENH05_00440 [Rhizobiales bacterium]|nr:hypothetical protein BMS3Bbin10_00439 [bacterium BMS3Bbin10]HDO51190.1 hypothetical protein [Hyphomicrobiales bacterium]
MSEDSPQGSEDAAWVTIETPYNAAELRSFLADVERLYRINSQLVFEEWRQTGENQYSLKAKNLSNDRLIETGLEVEPADDGITVRYSHGLRKATAFRVEAQPGGTAKLVVTDDYSGSSLSEREARIDEVDKSLVQWGENLYRYLGRWKRWSWVPGWKFYMRRVWQPMKPSARRIAFMLIVVTVAEFVVFLFVFTIFWLEMGRSLN